MEKVCILMSTYNGEKYIREQIDSILNQENVEIELVIRDDGSSDSTLDIINEYVSKSRVAFVEELSKKHNTLGVGNGFIQLLQYALNNYKDIQYFGFADQDDVWLRDKVSRGVDKLVQYIDEKALYFSKKKIVNEQLEYIRDDYINFNNEYSDFLSQNDASGCTMLFNRNFGEFIMQSPILERPYLHDVYFSKVALCTNTIFIYDPYESMLYRQHSSNVEGVRKVSVINSKNIKKLLKKRRHFLLRITTDILENYSGYLKDGYENVLNHITRYKNPLYAMKLLKMYYKTKHRSFKEKIRMTAMIIFHGV